jgi:hypothetical protein
MKHASRLLSLLVLTVAFALLAGSSCTSKTAPDRAWDRGAFAPVSANQQTYSLPAGITIDSLYGSLDSTTSESDLPLYMQVSSTKSGDTPVTFPAGLVFDPGSADYAYMMVLKDFTFTAKAGVTKGIYVPTYKCNTDLDDPDDASNYTVAGREWDKETQELLDIVASKKLNTSDAVGLAQDALTEITDDSGLTEATRTALKALP